MSTKKKIVVLASMVVLLVVTTTLNIIMGLNTGTDTPASAGTASSDFYAEKRATRVSELDTLVVYYDSIINNENTPVDQIETATSQKLALLEAAQTQEILETAIKSAGYDDAIVAIDTLSDNVYVYLKISELTIEDMTSVCSIITDNSAGIVETSIKFNNVI